MGYRGTLLAALLVGAIAAHQPLFAADAPKLADAAQKQDKAAVQTLIRDKVNVNATQADGATALHWAAHWDDLGMADLLIAAGANVNAKNDYSATPLSLQASRKPPSRSWYTTMSWKPPRKATRRWPLRMRCSVAR